MARLLLPRRGVILQQLRHSLVQILLVLFLVAAGIERLRGCSCPNKLFGRRVIDIENQRSITYRGTCGGSHSAEAGAAHTVCVPLLFFVDGNLITDQEIGFVTVRFCQSLGGQLRIHGTLDLRVRNLIRVRSAFNYYPFVSVIFGKIRSGHEIVFYVLRQYRLAREQNQSRYYRELNYASAALRIHSYSFWKCRWPSESR